MVTDRRAGNDGHVTNDYRRWRQFLPIDAATASPKAQPSAEQATRVAG
nr:hypothetical protein [Pseudomonas syringae pv. actinidiae]QOQ33552.1 hypothetical protein [Pseudomonas syringae pv. actinidiae]